MDVSALTNNIKKAFELIFKTPGISRSSIMDALDTTPATTTRLIAAMEQQNLIVEQAERVGKRGQPTKKLYIKNQHYYSVGINFTHSSIELAIINFDGSWLDSKKQTLEHPDIVHIESVAQALLSTLLNQHNLTEQQLIGIGIAVPGDFMPGGESMHIHPYFKTLADFNLNQHFNDFFSQNVYIESDSNCATLAELLVGQGKAFKHFMSLYLGYGVGSGLVINNKPYRGVNGNSGVIGGQFPDVNTIRPSGHNLLEFLQRNGVNVSNFQQMEDLYQQGCEPMEQWLTCASIQLQDKLSHITNLLDVESLIVGGRLPLNILNAITDRINTSTYSASHPLPKPNIICSDIGKRVGVHGAALLPIYRNCFA